MKLIYLAPIFSACFVLCAAAQVQPVKVDPKDEVVLSRFIEHAKKGAQSITPEHLKTIDTPETLCWVDFKNLGLSLTAYELTGDAEHLRDFAKGFVPLRDAMTKGPEDLLGWYGKPIPSLRDPAKPDVVIAEIQTEFRAIGILAKFVELTSKDPALTKEFEATRQDYLQLMENDLFKKWELYYADLNERGGVYRWNKDYIPNKANITLAHEKQANLIEGLLNLYRASGKAIYRDRAEKMGIYLKSCMRTEADHYVWNYWDSTGDWDKADGKLKHWVDVEPKGTWYAVTVESALNLYHHGLVFDDADVQKLVRTQMQVCWNGDAENPVYKMVSGATPKETERFIAPSLAPWDAKLAAFIYSGPIQEERIAKSKDFWQGGVLASDWLRGKYLELPQGTKRRYVKSN